jgi:predicted ribosomally synthesized six-cysteine peptide SCIFF
MEFLQYNLISERGFLNMSKHIVTVVKPNLKRDAKDINCRECATSCQSACKTSCTVGNQTCKHS